MPQIETDDGPEAISDLAALIADMQHYGDDLEDDFVADGLVVLSGEEAEAYPIGDASDVGDLESTTSGLSATEEQFPSPNDRGAKEKKRKRKEKIKENKAKKRKLVEAVESVEHSVAEQSPYELSRYLASMQAKSYPRMTSLELEGIRIPELSIADTTSWTGTRTLDDLVPFIIKVLPSLHTRLMQRSKSNGAPTLLFITGAALRVADVTRVLKDKRLRGDKGADVAKLFAKHFKLAEHVIYLKRTKVGSAAGTPGRIGKLLCETDSLSISALSHIMLDVSFKDAKKRNLLDIPETRDEVFKTVLGAPPVLSAIRSGKVQVVLF